MSDQVWPGTPLSEYVGRNTTPTPAADNQQWPGTSLSEFEQRGNADMMRGEQWARHPVTGLPIPGLPAGADVQILSNATGPVADAMGKDIREGGAGVGTIAAGSLATDKEQQRRIVASQMFPNMNLRDALPRVAYGPDGRLYAVGVDGTPAYVDPQSLSLSNPSTLRPSNLARQAASLAGGALPMAGGIAGGVASGPTSLIAGPALAASGAAAGDAARQFAADYMDPGDPYANGAKPGYNVRQTAIEAGLAGAGQAGGALFNRWMSPNRLRVSEQDARMLARNPNAIAVARQNADEAAGIRVNLTPGQAANARSLLQYEDAAMQNPNLVDRATAYYRQQGQQLQNAGQDVLSLISPQVDKTMGSQAFREAASEVPATIRQAANLEGRPYYEAAERAAYAPTRGLAEMMRNPAVEDAMAQARGTYRILKGRIAPDLPDFQLWDLTRRSLRDMGIAARREGNNTRAYGLEDALLRLTGHLDTTFSSYPAARAAVAPGQRLAATLEETATGAAGATGVDDRARNILAPIFERSNPQYVASTRRAFAEAGREDEWNQGVRAYLQDVFDRASRSQEGLNASMLRRQVWGNVDNRDALRAAMTPQQFEGFDRFMRVVENVSRTYPQNSLTAMRGNAQAALSEAAQDTGTRALAVAERATSPIRFADTLGSIFEWVKKGRIDRNASRIVDNLFSPNGVAYLEQMARMGPNTRQAATLTSYFLTQIGAAGGDDETPTLAQK